MKTLTLTAFSLLLAAPVFADQPLGIVLQSDGPWIDLPDGVVINAAAPSMEDIYMMADLDGDPSVTTEKEAQMIAVLADVLLGEPISY